MCFPLKNDQSTQPWVFTSWEYRSGTEGGGLGTDYRRNGIPGSGNKGLLGILGQSPQKSPGSRIAKRTQQREGWAKEEDDQFSWSN